VYKTRESGFTPVQVRTASILVLIEYPKGCFSMQAITDFLSQWYVLAGMGVLLAALIGAMIFIRMKRKDDDD
jgi:hypothetical protein